MQCIFVFMNRCRLTGESVSAKASFEELGENNKVFVGRAAYVDPNNCGSQTLLTCETKVTFFTEDSTSATFGGKTCIPLELKDECASSTNVTLGDYVKANIELSLFSGATAASLSSVVSIALAGFFFA